MNAGEFASLRTVFHEPNRLAIVAALAGEKGGLGFVDLREALGLTNGNLSRHVKMLEESEVVVLVKSFQGVKPHTQILLTTAGRERFADYLKDLETVLNVANSSLSAQAGELEPVQA